MVANMGLALYTVQILQTDPTPGNTCGDNNVSWVLYLLLVMHGTNIFQQICKITNLDHCFKMKRLDLYMNFYEIAVLFFM
jgi:hypothetical protein